MGNDAVFALAVRKIVWGGDATSRAKHRVPPRLHPVFLGRDARHRGGITVGGLRFEAAALLCVTARKPTTEAGKDARITLGLTILGSGRALLGLVGL